jgi:ring-1,2-phenylacetyl-CoA epoxidase subunit PaaD
MRGERFPGEPDVWAALEGVKDPEIPVVSVVELGIVQSVAVEAGNVRVTITPTFLGCPALETMRAEIGAALRALGFTAVVVDVVLSPPWTSDRIAPSAREKMRAIGIVPPPSTRFQPDATLALAPDRARTPATCPFCKSRDTVLDSPFGPTICRAVHYCRSCRQSFEEFKAL